MLYIYFEVTQVEDMELRLHLVLFWGKKHFLEGQKLFWVILRCLVKVLKQFFGFSKS